jgi:hypothetical protein
MDEEEESSIACDDRRAADRRRFVCNALATAVAAIAGDWGEVG